MFPSPAAEGAKVSKEAWDRLVSKDAEQLRVRTKHADSCVSQRAVSTDIENEESWTELDTPRQAKQWLARGLGTFLHLVGGQRRGKTLEPLTRHGKEKIPAEPRDRHLCTPGSLVKGPSQLK